MNGTREHLALWRHYEAAAEAAAALLSLCRCRLTDREPLFGLQVRQRLQLLDLLHQFSYNARHAIELAEELEPGIIAHAQAIPVHAGRESTIDLEIGSEAHQLVDQSVWWVLGRVIHARDLEIRYLEDAEVGTEWAAAPAITGYSTPVAFSVRSDFDGPDECHFVLVEELLAGFVALRLRFSKAFQAAGFPIEEPSLHI